MLKVARRLRAEHSPARLRLFLGLLLLALTIPSAVLIWQTQQQLRWESLHQYRTLAEEMAQRIDAELGRRIALEEARSEAEYQYLVVAGDPNSSTLVQRSPLAELNAEQHFPGLLGHFQIDPDGRFSTPLLPDQDQVNPALGLDGADLAQRQQIQGELRQVLSSNQLIENERAAVLGASREEAKSELAEKEDKLQAAAEEVSSQAAFDQLAKQSVSEVSNNLGRVDELRLNRDYADSDTVQRQQLDSQVLKQVAENTRGKRKERNAVYEAIGSLSRLDRDSADSPIQIFESEVDPLEFSLLASGHGVLYRRVWRDGQRTIQGLVFDQQRFAQELVAAAFEGTALWEMSDLVLAYRQNVLQLIPGERARGGLYRASQIQGELLYQTRLSAPIDQMELIWSVRRLPPGPGARVVQMASVVLAAVLLVGFWLLYRTGMRQIRLARQQQDFVSAVSHELKTPLTSIRMYAEMLREGWAGEEKKRGYYDYIHDESERLSRLITNVLQLARMERNELTLDRQSRSVEELMDLLRSKLASQIERAGFVADYRIDPACGGAQLSVDTDALCQMLINLVDNALKFAQGAEQRRVEVAATRLPSGVQFSVRDYGPGVAKSQLKKIFQLFYRPGNELTRESLGTGIGLALVRQLARAMDGDVEVINRQPGAEFQIRLPIVD